MASISPDMYRMIVDVAAEKILERYPQGNVLIISSLQ
jgi:hypothetical protein